RAIDVGDARAQRGVAEALGCLWVESAARSRVDIRSAERLAEDSLEQESLFVGRAAADRRRCRCTRAAQPLDRGVERALPAGGAQVAAVPDERLDDAALRMGRLIAEPALVAKPAVVDVRVLAREHALDPVVAHGEVDV